MANLRSRRNTPPSEAELIARQALGHAKAIGMGLGARISVPGDPPPDYNDWAKCLMPFLTEHPMRHATEEMVSLHEAGHYIAFERLGMIATFASIAGSAFDRCGMGGEAGALKAAAPAPYWDPEEFRSRGDIGVRRACR